MGNINSGQLTCSNLDKLGFDRQSDVPDRCFNTVQITQAHWPKLEFTHCLYG